MLTTKKATKIRFEPKPQEPPPPNDGFALFDLTTVHYLKRRGKRYVSMCGLELKPHNSRSNSMLFNAAYPLLESGKWCEHCRKTWQLQVEGALETLKRDGKKVTVHRQKSR